MDKKEIEKMYENAGVKFRKVCTNVDCDCDEMFCDECEYFKDNIFAFTTEKQIEIIKFLISKHARFDTFKDCAQKDLYMVHYECRYFPKQYFPFEEALAESINYLWQSLTEEEHKQVREILK